MFRRRPVRAFCCLLLTVCHAASCLRLTELRVEERAVVGRGTLLVCEYDLQGETLYAVKWYKDGREFYRFVPEDSPAVLVFNVDGVSVDVARSSDGRVTLTSVDAATGGRYRCEVTAEAPMFRTATGNGFMETVTVTTTTTTTVVPPPRLTTAADDDDSGQDDADFNLGGTSSPKDAAGSRANAIRLFEKDKFPVLLDCCSVLFSIIIIVIVIMLFV